MVAAYRGVLATFMTYTHERDPPYNKDYNFSLEQLSAIVPGDVVNYFNYRAYGVETPGDEDRPVHARSNAVKFWKKALSFFMPNRHMQWNNISNVGNPTRSTAVNELIKKIKKFEVRRQGAPPKARRSYTKNEFAHTQNILKERGECINSKYGIRALNNFQYHMIGRIDDCTQYFLENLEPHPEFNFNLKGKMCWSKNVQEERDAPWQCLLASMETRFCVFVSLALWLEIMLGSTAYGAQTPYVFAFNDDVSIPHGGIKSKEFVQTYLREEVFSEDFFVGPLGSHSGRKFASTECRKRGCSKDEKDIRGRWKSTRRVSDVYDDIELPYVDAKVAGCLCMGGPCKYVLKNNSGVTNNFILEYVTPNIALRLGDEVAVRLGTALLYYIFTAEGAAGK